MEKQRTSSPVPVASKPIAQQRVGCPSQPTGAMSSSISSSVFKVRVPRNLAKKYSIMRFQSAKVDFSSITKAQMARVTETSEEKGSETLPTFGAGSEFGKERREEARKKRRGFVTKEKDPEASPWSLRLGGKSGKRFTGRKEAGINENSSYYILTQCEDGTFQAVPVNNWYNFTADIKYQTLTADEAEQEFGRRERTVNYFSLMIKKRLDNKEEQEEGDENKDKTGRRAGNLIIHDDERELSRSEDDEDSGDDNDDKGRNKNTEDKQTKKDWSKAAPKKQTKNRKGSEVDSDAFSEEDGYLDSKEVDYMSDTSSSSEEDVKVVEVSKPKAEDDLNAEETSSEEDEDLTREGLELKDMLERDEGKESSDEEEDEQDPDQDDIKGTSALFLQGAKKKKGKSGGSGSSTSSNSRSSTPTALVEGTVNSIVAAAASKLSLDRPGTTPSKSKKRPASQGKNGTTSEEGSPASKKSRVSPASSLGNGGGSRTSTPTPSGSEEGPQGITEEAVKRYLTRKPMTTKDLLQKFKSKRTGLSNDQTVKMIAAILRKLQPEQKTIKGKLYLSMKQLS